jgi:tRNA pseudouridine32 synthase/23S rRNA pseudouridine746 synthase/23S rRNA pseudouridine1911/1915/1917 synthase
MSKKKRKRRPKHCGPKMMGVIFEDDALVVVDKPAGLLTVTTDKRSTRTAYHFLNEYVRRRAPRSNRKVHIVHRLDQATSGVLVFAKSREVKDAIQSAWDRTRKTYLAVVEGIFDRDQMTVSSYLAENRAHNVYSTRDRTVGKLATTGFNVIARGRDTTLLEVDLVTGRKHQIRVHLADLGHPVVGDRKYGKGTGRHKRLLLHASRIEFAHPLNHGRLELTAPTPAEFDRFVGS